MRVVAAADARATIARLVLGDAPEPAALGGVRLHGHQVEGAARLRRLLDDHRGAWLADEVGLGKTFTALALASGQDTLVVAPAALRHTWREAAERAGVPIRFVSMEALGRGDAPKGAAFIIVDEAHHFRHAGTKRFHALARLAAGARILLLSATPVQNRESDLRVPLSLFLGESAFALPLDRLACFVVRRTADAIGATATRLPAIASMQWLPPVEDGDCLDLILALPDPVPPRDGGLARALLAYSLARQWASSRAALRAAVRRRIARGQALLDAIGTGRLPSRSELAAWTCADGAQQLPFPELVVETAPLAAEGLPELRDRVEAHLHGMRSLAAWLNASPDPDVARAACLGQLLAAHRGARIVAFSEYTETVRGLFPLLAGRHRVGMLTHAGGRVAGGPMSRREIVDRFAPGSGQTMPEAERIDLLLTTDVLSEGVGLHDAGVLVHLDLSWNPARLEQRVGRLRRIGATSRDIAVYAMRPPAATDRLIRMEQRLREKLAVAARTVGVAGAIIPGWQASARSRVEAEHGINLTLRRWRARSHGPPGPVAAAVRSTRAGAILCVSGGGQASLVALDGGRFTRDRDTVAGLLASAEGSDAEVERVVLDRVVTLAADWLRRDAVAEVVDIGALRLARSRTSLLRRVDGISRRTPRHAQTRLAPLVRAVRSAATATLPAGAERVLDELVHAPLADEAWLRAVGQFAELHSPTAAPAPTLEVVLLLVP